MPRNKKKDSVQTLHYMHIHVRAGALYTRGGLADILPKRYCFFLFFLPSHLTPSQYSGWLVVTRDQPISPPVHASSFYRALGSALPQLVDFRRTLRHTDIRYIPDLTVHCYGNESSVNRRAAGVLNSMRDKNPRHAPRERWDDPL